MADRRLINDVVREMFISYDVVGVSIPNYFGRFIVVDLIIDHDLRRASTLSPYCSCRSFRVPVQLIVIVDC